MQSARRSAPVGTSLVVALALAWSASIAAAQSETPMFNTAKGASGGEEPVALQAADLDGDGDKDLVIAHEESREVVVHQGLGDGTFTSVSVTELDWPPTDLALGDVDKDGAPDALVTSPFLPDIVLLTGNGDGTLAAPTMITNGSPPYAVELADISGDGNLDMLVVRQIIDRIGLLLGDGNGGFTNSQVPVVGAEPQDIAVGDVNLDGQLDVVSVNKSGGSISFIPGLPAGTLGSSTEIPIATLPETLALADFNGDGTLDVAVTEGSFVADLVVADGNGDGTFAAPVSLPYASNDSVLAHGDVNRDGIADLVVVDDEEYDANVLFGGVSGLTFDSAVTTTRFTTGIILVDGDGDGALDLASVDVMVDSYELIRGVGDGTFVHPRDAAIAGERAFAPEVVDMNGDGHLDVVHGEEDAQFDPTTITVQLNDGNGVLTQSDSVVVGENVRDIAVGDIDGDLVPDVVAAQDGPVSHFAVVLLGDGDGTLTQGTSVPLGFEPYFLELADVNDDGDLDIVVMDISPGLPDTLAVHLGNGDGTFGAAIDTTLAPRPIDFELAHLNGDAFLDAVVVNWGGAPDQIEVFHGDGDGSFTSVQVFTAPEDNPFDVEIGDLDEDGNDDLVLFMAYDDLYLAAGLPDGTFGPLVFEATNSLTPTQPLLVDIDGDTHLDWLCVGNVNSGLTVRLGDGTLSLGAERIFGVGEVTGWLDTGDMDGDGLTDVVLAADIADAAIRTVFQQREDAWIGLGHALRGTGGEPTMLGTGTFEGNTVITLSIAGGLPFGSVLFFLGFFELSVPFKGGILVPNPSPGAIIPLPLDAVGGIDVPILWPTGIPAGLPTYWQAWSQDPEGIFGWSATNAVQGMTP